jgi:hypothetical protein
MNANLYGPLQPSSLTRGRPPQPPRPLLPRPKPRWRRGAKRLDRADVRCEGSSRIFCKIHYRAGSLREIHYVRDLYAKSTTCGLGAHTTFDVGYSDARTLRLLVCLAIGSKPGGLVHPLPGSKAPVEKGGQAVGWSGRIDGPETSQALKGRNLAPCCQGAVTQASSNSACFMLFPAVTK